LPQDGHCFVSDLRPVEDIEARSFDCPLIQLVPSIDDIIGK